MNADSGELEVGAVLDEAQRTLRQEQVAREARERRARRVTLAAAVLLSVAALGVSILAATTRAEEVAPQVAERVAERVGGLVVQSARAERVEVGRRKLGEANTQLIARDLPVVADPGDSATGDELIIAAATARVLAVLPETTVGRLRDEVRDGRLPAVLPSSTRIDDLPLEDRVVEVIPAPSDEAQADRPDPAPVPERHSPGARPAPAPSRPTARPTPAPAQRVPAPQPQPESDRGLCLLGLLLC